MADLTKYPQGFISQIENRRVSAPIQFQQNLMEVLGIPSLEPYYLPSPEEQVAQNLANGANEFQQTVNRLLDIIDRRDERIRELENENKRLQDIIIMCKK
ncbi:MAG: hypothetical protein IIY87_05330 [Bacteroidales bacterium]|nr:hypothetical protein [Bacteroidales bacterium]